MKTPFLDLKQTDDGWQAGFAFQVFHRNPEDWLRMRWGFNAGALLEEALDRAKLFIEAQSISDAEFRSIIQPTRTFALRGLNIPGIGLQMALIGKVSTEDRETVQKTALNYARELYSTLPQDFISIPIEKSNDYDRLLGRNLLKSQVNIVQIQRGIVPTPGADHRFFHGLWQSSSRSNEQIWRALSNMPRQALFNIQLQPTFFYEGERQAFRELKKRISNLEQATELTPVAIPWIENIIKRRLAIWKKFFILQVHVITEGEVDENLIRSIGSALTRDTGDQPLPGFQIYCPDSGETARSWCENILHLEFIPSPRLEDLADSDEAFAVFRFPYFPEAGIPGANFVPLPQESPHQTNQDH